MATSINKGLFDAEEAAATATELRASFDSGKTKSYEWRASQLKKLQSLIENHEEEIITALYSDLSKPEAEAYIQEVSFLSLLNLFLIIANISFTSFSLDVHNFLVVEFCFF